MNGLAEPTLLDRLEYGLVLLVAGASGRVPLAAAERLGAVLGGLAYRPLGIRRSVVESNLSAAYPDRPPQWLRDTAAAAYRHLGRESLMMLRLSRMDAAAVRERTIVDGLAEFRAALERGRGVVLVTGHFGNWEIGGAALAARGVPLDVVARRQRNPLFDRMLTESRERLGMRVFERTRAPALALRSLRAGRVVAFVADQDAKQAGVFVPFFGRCASTYRGPALLALRAGAPVFLGTATRGEGARYDIKLQEVPRPAKVDEDDALTWTAECTRRLEAAIRSVPEQYFWHHRRWKTAPKEPVQPQPV